MRWLADTLEAGRQSAVLTIHSRMFVFLLGLCAVIAGGFWLVARRAAPHEAGDQFFGMITYMVFFQFGLPFTVMYFGVMAVNREIEDRSVTYLFVRPVRRSSLLLGKWLAVAIVGTIVAALAILMLYAVLALPDLPWSRGLRPTPVMLGSFIGAAAMSVAAYAAVGVCFGAVSKRPLITGIAFVIGWEFLVSHTPPQAGVRGMTVADPVRRWLLQTMEPTGHLQEMLMRDLDPLWLTPERLGNPVTSLLWFTGVMLAVAVWVYGRREYDSRARE